MKHKLGYAVYVEWIDSSVCPGWKTEPFCGEPAKIVSCGILVHFDEYGITIALGMSDNEDYHDQMKIPKLAILKVKRISSFKMRPDKITL